MDSDRYDEDKLGLKTRLDWNPNRSNRSFEEECTKQEEVEMLQLTAEKFDINFQYFLFEKQMRYQRTKRYY